MCKVQMLRSLVKQRLTAAAEEIFGLFERTIAEYEEELSRSKEENERQRKLLDAVLNPQLRLHRADVQQLLVFKDEVPPEQQQQWSSSLDQEDPEPPHIKEEQEEFWTSQEEEQLQWLEEADITKFPFSPVPVNGEDDEEEPQSSQLHQRRTEQMKTEADGEDCGGPEPASNPDPEPDTGDWEETRAPHAGLNLLNNKVPVGDLWCCTGGKPFSCSECDKRYGTKAHLKRHIRTHKGGKPFSCSVCNKSFTHSGNLQLHMRIHTGEKPFSCGGCNEAFTWPNQLKRHKCHQSSQLHQRQTEHMKTETDEEEYEGSDSSVPDIELNIVKKPFGCSECGKKNGTNGYLKEHMRTHTGEKPFSCSVCGKRFIQKVLLTYHDT